MVMKDFNVIVEKDAEGWLIASVPQLHECHTQAKTMDELIERTEEAIILCLEDLDEAAQIPNEFIGVQKITIQ